jgi:glycine cleavage system regulatory protein
MDDENIMPETLDTIAKRITALGGSIDERFTKVDKQFATIEQRFTKVDERFAKVDQQFSETKAHLGVKIEALGAKVDLVYEAVIALQDHTAVNASDHKRFTARLDNHDIRILALEPPKPAKR